MWRYRSHRDVFALIGGAALLGGCVNPAFRESISEYGALTKAAAAQQNARVATVAAEEEERIRSGFAENRVDLRLKPDCAARLLTDPAGGGAAPVCTLVGVGGTEIEQAPGFANILALTDALSDYADNLIVLAADSTSDRAAFSQALQALGTSVGNLDGAVRAAAKAPPRQDGAKIGAVATLLADAGNLYFAQRRAAALKRIVIASDPVVQEATALLSGVDDRLQLYYRAELASALLSAQANASMVAGTPTSSTQDVRTAQDALFQALAAYNNQGADTLRYKAIGEAHAKLAAAARRGASPAELRDAISAVVQLAATAGTTIHTLEGDRGTRRHGR
ncbi:MAG TPA: hypothetical protein VGB65_06220 [Allosphingosinicella sp.]|jgi:hypothetical protein